LFSFEPIDRRRYRIVMALAGGLMIFLISNIENFLRTITLFLECTNYYWLCSNLRSEIPEFIILAAIIVFMVTAAVATIRRVKNTSASNYWAVLLLVLITLDYQFLTGLDVIWQSDLNSGFFQLPVPWFLLTAISLIFLLSFASESSEYFMSGYWNADPPLGYGLSLSSFWLLAFSPIKLASIQAIALDNYSLFQTAESIQMQLESMLPQFLISPIIPAVIFIISAILLIFLGRLKNEDASGGTPQSSNDALIRRRKFTHTT